jgi:post-segregation antitoxin (ccd killing protein)
MPRVQVYLPENHYAELKGRGLPASELLQVAVQAEIERRNALDATDEYLAELAAEVGEPSTRDRARARAIVRRIQDRQCTRPAEKCWCLIAAVLVDFLSGRGSRLPFSKSFVRRVFGRRSFQRWFWWSHFGAIRSVMPPRTAF